MKKRLVAFVLIVSMLFAMVACAAPSTEQPAAAAPAAPAAAAESKPAAAAEPAAEPEVIKIGFVTSLSTNEEMARQVKIMVGILEEAINGVVDINLPLHDVEGLPNLGGAKVQAVFGDTGATADVCMTEVERLITQEGVIGVCGNFNSGSTKTSMVPAEKYDKLIISEGTSVTLLDQGYTNFTRTFPGDDLFIQQSFEFLKTMNDQKNAGIKTVAIVSEDSEFGASISEQERKYAAEYGFEVVEDISYTATASNVTSEVMRLKAVDADVVLMSSYLTDALLFVKTFKEQNYAPKMLFGQRGGFQNSEFIPSLAEDANYVYSTARWASDFKSDIAQAISAEFTKRAGSTLTGDMLATAWDFYVMALAANQAGSTECADMLAEMHKGIVIDPAQDPTGLPGYVYGENGQNTKTAAVVLQIQDGAFKTVYPFEGASTEFVYPAPAWTER